MRRPSVQTHDSHGRWLAVIEDAGHVMFVDQPEETVHAVRDALSPQHKESRW